MQRRRPHTIQFEALERKLLLSSAAADPAAAVHAAARSAKLFLLNSKPYVFLTSRRSPRDPYGSGYQLELSFGGRKQKIGSMGESDMDEHLVPKLLTGNELPDLGGATMTFSNAKGTVVLSIATSNASSYRFAITSATGKFASAVGGTGSMTIGLNHPKPPHSPQYILTLRSDRP